MPPRRGKNLSLEIREKLLKAVNEQHLSISEAAHNLMVPRTTAFSFFKHYRETDQAQAKKQGGNRQPVLTQEHLD